MYQIVFVAGSAVIFTATFMFRKTDNMWR